MTETSLHTECYLRIVQIVVLCEFNWRTRETGCNIVADHQASYKMRRLIRVPAKFGLPGASENLQRNCQTKQKNKRKYLGPCPGDGALILLLQYCSLLCRHYNQWAIR